MRRIQSGPYVLGISSGASVGAVRIFDEPTSHLNIKHQPDLPALVRQLELTALAALNGLNLAARYHDHPVMLNKGEVATSGPGGCTFGSRNTG